MARSHDVQERAVELNDRSTLNEFFVRLLREHPEGATARVHENYCGRDLGIVP